MTDGNGVRAISCMNHLIGVAAVVLVLLVAYRLTRPALPWVPSSRRPLVLQNWKIQGDEGIRRGAKDARVVLVVWSDHLCEYCYEAEKELRVLIRSFPEALSVVYRHRPVLGSASKIAAIAVQCAAEQHRFEEMHQSLFERRDSLGFIEWQSYAVAAGVPDLIQFDNCLLGDTHAEKTVEHDNAVADSLGLRGTPAILLDSLLFRGFPGRRYVSAYIRSQPGFRQ